MSAPTAKRISPPRLAVSKTDAAASLGVSVQLFEAEIMPDLKVALVGRRQLVPVRELERWLNQRAGIAA
jgi:hypothetical protein